MNRRYRKTVIAGNWKMNKTAPEAREFVEKLRPAAAKAKWCETVLCVPFTDIQTCVKAAKSARIFIGAQNVHEAKSGAFTGEISAEMLDVLGAKYVIIGHSERRQYFSETDDTINAKVRAALGAGMHPILCVGESRVQRDLSVQEDFVRMQVKSDLSGLTPSEVRKVVIAYEPIWAIGTGQTASADDAQEICRMIRETIRKMHGARCARAVSILYGGSMNEKNASELLSKPDIDGGLIGGASLDVKKFSAIIDAANQ